MTVIKDQYLAVADVAVNLLADPAVATTWDRPSALEGYAVSGLAGHLAGQINVLAKVLAGSEPDTAPIPRITPLTARVRWPLAPRQCCGSYTSSCHTSPTTESWPHRHRPRIDSSGTRTGHYRGVLRQER